MLERDVEDYLRKEIKKLGGIAYKFTSPARRSVPDRLCLLPSGKMAFVECKATGKKPTKLQIREIDKLQKLGFLVGVVDSYESVDKFVIEFVQARS